MSFSTRTYTTASTQLCQTIASNNIITPNQHRKPAAFMRWFFILLMMVGGVAVNNAYAQPTVLGTQLVNGGYTTYDLTTVGGFKQIRLQATSSAGTGSRNWEFASGTAAATDYSTNWRPYTSGLTLAAYNTSIAPVGGTASALLNTSFGGQSGLLPAVTANNYYTVNVANTTGNNDMAILETNFNPAAIVSRTQSAAVTWQATTVTATLAAAPAVGENVFVRYTTDNFTTSTLVQLSFVGATGTATIPAQVAATNVAYYFLSSPVTPTHATADMLTLNLLNNGGANYTYTTSANNILVNSTTGTSTSASYATLAAAITAINGAVIHTGTISTLVNAGHTETAPAGGYSITATGTLANPITFSKFGAGANPTFTASGALTVGALNDGIFKIIGADYITLDGFTMLENAANTVTTAGSNTMTEFGVALLYATSTNGAQNNTIKNCTIDLNRTYQNTFGVYSNSTHSATAVTTSATATTTAGGNSGLIITGNTITDVNIGIVVIGPTAIADNNNGITIGGSLADANNINNFGTTGTFSSYANVSGTVNGILIRNSINFNISFNTVASSNGGVTAGTLNGIQVAASSNTPTATFTNSINNNNISLRSGLIAGGMVGITYPSGSASTTSTVNINNNDFNTFGHTVSGTAAITFISIASTNQTTNINGNTFTNISVNTTGSVTFISHSYSIAAGGSCSINNNAIITAFNKTGAGGTITFSTTNGSSPNGTTATYTGNNFSNIVVTGATAITGINNTDGAGTSAAKTITGNIFNSWTGGTSTLLGMNVTYVGATTTSISNNTFTNWSGQSTITAMSVGSSFNGATVLNLANNTMNNLVSSGTGGAVTGMTCSNTSATININGNVIHTLSTTAASAVIGLGVTGATTTNVFRNKIYNLSGSAAGSTVNGLLVSSGTTVNLYNNLIGDLRTPAANAANPLIGLNITGGTTINTYYNTVYLNGTSSGALFGSSAISTSTTPTLTLQNNVFVNSSAVTGAGLATAYRRSSATLTSYAAASNNNDFFGSTIFTDGTNTDATLVDYKTRVSTRDAASVSENPTFVSTTGSDATFLHINTVTPTALESGGVTVSVTDDFDGDTRGATPDIGADEFAGTPLPVCAGTPASSTINGVASVCSGTGTTLSLSTVYTDLGITYQWASTTTSGSGYTNLGTSATQATGNLTTTTYYIATITCTNSGLSFTTAEKEVLVNPLPVVNVSPAAVSICAGGSTTLTEDGGQATSWSWSPGGATTQAITVSPSTTTTYTVTATLNGCSATDNATVTVNPIPAAVVITPPSAAVCAGSSVNLVASGGTVTSSSTVTLGAGVSTTTPSTVASTLGPNPLQSYYGGSKQQMLVTATELTGLGLSAGSSINSIAFNLATVESRTLQNYVVKMQHTLTASFASTAFVTTGFTTVRTAANLIPVSGWNTIALNTPFVWDGSSNLLIETNQSNNDGGGTGTNTAVFGTTGFASTLFYRVDNNTAAAVDAATTASFAAYSSRNNMQFGFSNTTPANFTWSPADDLNTTSGANVTSTPTANRTYEATSTINGCSSSNTVNVTVHPLPTATIGGTTTVCQSATAPLVTFTGDNGTAPYTFTYNINGGTNTTVTSLSGANPVSVTLAATTGTAGVFNYNLVSVQDASAATCSNPQTGTATITVTATVNPGTISGTSPICIGQNVTYTTNGDAGGTWSSDNAAAATVDPGTGVVTGVAPGTANIIYTISSGCGSPLSSQQAVTVNANVNAGTVSGLSPICIGQTTTYTSTGDAGGSWSSTDVLVATVNPTSGLVTGVGAGTATITYTVTGCAGPAAASQSITVSPNANAGTVSGTSPLCIGGSATYSSNGDLGGTWSSTNPAVATVDAGGVVTALTAGTTNITYTVSTGCNNPVSSFATLTVSPNVNAGTVSGTSPLCIGATATYTSNGDAGGTWSSTNPAVATVDAGGLVTALSAGTTDITYTVNGCAGPASAFQTLTVSPNANAGTVTGTSPLCIGATATYTSNGDAGGTWSSTNPAVATVDAGGLVTALTAGTTNITYTVSTGCNNPVSSFQALTVSPNANAGTVSGTSPLCIGATATYTSNGDAGGTWSSTNPAVATVDAGGLVTALSAGTTDITYTVSTGCASPVSAFATLTVNVNANAGTVTGTSPLCIGATATYTSTGDAGGTWSSTNPLVASVDAGGVVTALSAGTTDITYTVSTGCNNPVSSFQTLTVSPNANAGTVSGTSPLCIGATATYTSNGDAGGTWSSTNPAVATVDAGGLVTALTAGTTNITYTVSTGCNNPVSSFATLTVSPNVDAGEVTGASPLCIGATGFYASTGDAGGVWSSTNPLVASVDAGSGLVTALSAGTTDITYTVNGCAGPASAFQSLTVSPNVNAGAVTGTSPLCIGASATYTSTGDAGGTWSSTNPLVASVVAGTGVVTALSAGTTDITYTVNGCAGPASAFQTLTVSPNANAGTVNGNSPLCVGGTTTYTSTGDAGGTWSSTNPLVASVDAGGVVTALSPGTTDITYTVSTGCNNPVSAFKTLTVNANANAGTVTGTSPLCIGATATYTSDGDPDGAWSSTNPLVASVDAGGVVTALSAGTTDITYTLSSCLAPVSSFATLTVSPNANAGTVSGTSPLCIGATATYTSTGDAGGAWSSTNPLVASVDAGGVVTALSAGTTDITYTVSTGCNNPVSSFQTLTVSPNANAGTVTGTSPLCIGATATYTSNGDAGGTWSSTNPAVATVDAGGLVTALTAGTTDITYTVSTGCNNPVSSFQTLTVNPNVNAGTVSGTSPLCIGATATYTSNGDAGGTWSSTNPAVATVDAGGLVTALSAGTTDITYTVNGCAGPASAFQTLTVSPNANAGTVTGTSPLCIGATATYTSNGDAGGTWSSTNPAVATVDAGGLVTALTAGTTNITYTVSTGCNNPVSSFQALTVSPNANAGTVSGTSPLCIGATATYTSNGDAGGTWSSTNPAVATVDAGGLVTALSAGTTDITYTVSTGCASPVSAFATLTVNVNANAGTVTGTSPLCIGATATYTSNGDAGGTWSSTNPAVATVDAGGVVTALSAGTTDITYTVSTGCNNPVSSFQTLTVSPNANAGTVSGTSPLCIGATATYTSTGDAGGTWSSTNPLVASVDAGGLVTALTAGTTDITYTVSTGCNNPVSSFQTLTVNPNVNAGAVTGTSPLCIGATATYTSNGDAGGSWSSTNPAVATVDAGGLVTALSAGTTDITYTVNGCAGPASAFQTLTVSPNANAGTVTGTSPLCIGATATYTSNGDAGGTWSSTNPAVASVDAGGLVTALTAGTTNITYTVSTGCNNPVSSFQALTVSPNANAGTVSGTSPLCIGATATYTSTGDAGGTWSSTNPAVATVDAGGLVTALSAGTTDITYTVSTGCASPVSAFATLTVNVNANAGTVTGTSPLCVGATATYTSNGDAGGTWSSSDAGVATVDPGTGLVTAIAAGTATITYTVNSGCNSPVSASQSVTVNAIPPAPSISVVNNHDGTSTLTAGGFTGTLLWSTLETTPSITVSAPGTYTVTQTVNGCTSPAGSAIASPDIFADPAVGGFDITDMADVSISANTIVLNQLAKVKLPVFNLNQDHVLPAGSTTLTIDLGTKFVLDPGFTLATAPLNNYFNWTSAVVSGHVIITGSQYAEIPADFAGEAVFQVQATTSCTSVITSDFEVDNHASTIILVDEDVNNNNSSLTYTVLVPAPTVSVTQPNCATATGTITVTAPTATGMTYSIDGTTYTNTTGVFTGVTPGSYNVTARTADGCTSAITIAVVDPQPLTPTITLDAVVNNVCHGGNTGSITVSAGVAPTPYTFTIAGPTVNTTGQTSGVFTGLTAGTYTVTVLSASGCSNSLTATVTEPSSVNPNLSLGSDYTDNLFATPGVTNTIVYNVSEVDGNPAVGDTLRISRVAGYSFTYNPAAVSVVVGSTTYTLDNTRWKLDNSNPSFISLILDPLANSTPGVLNCGQIVYLSIDMTRNTPNISTFSLSARLRKTNGEVNLTNNLNSIVMSAE